MWPHSLSKPSPPHRSRSRVAQPVLIFAPPQGAYTERLSRVMALRNKGTPEAISEVVAALGDEDERIRWLAGSVLQPVFPVLCLVTYIPVGLLLAWIIRSRRALRHATDPDLTPRTKPCTVCGTPQNPEREHVCMKCGKPFRAFPAGGWVSPFRRFDKVALVMFIVLGVVGNGFQHRRGAARSCAFGYRLAHRPWFCSRLDTPPKYWKTCGGAVYGPIDAEVRSRYLGERCDTCGDALPSTEPRASSPARLHQIEAVMRTIGATVQR